MQPRGNLGSRSSMIYLDHNATSPLLAEAGEAWLECVRRYPGNPSSPHRLGSRAEKVLDEAREKLAAALGCLAQEIVWTSGATEANNTVLHHYLKTLPPEGEIWISSIEHPCVIASAEAFPPGRVKWIPAGPDGGIELATLEEMRCKSRPGLVAVMAANNETGVLQPWKAILAWCRGHGIPFLCDAVQWLGRLPCDGLGACDWVSGSAHKFGGPKGVGFLKCPRGTPVVPLLRGGPQESRRRAGTEDAAGVFSMMKAFEIRRDLMRADTILERREWREAFEQRLRSRLPETEVVGGARERLWNTISAVMPETDHRGRWVVKLDREGFAVSTGSACASGKEEPSHVLAAMGYSGSKAGRVLRFSSSWETSPADWDALLEALVRVYGSLK